jgi:hypothetical protein
MPGQQGMAGEQGLAGCDGVKVILIIVINFIKIYI